MVADSYAIDQNKDVANQRLLGFSDKDKADSLGRLKAAAKDAQAARIQGLADGLGVKLGSTSTPATTPQPGGGLPPLALLGILLVLIGGSGALYYWFSRQRTPVDATPVPLRARDRVMTSASPSPAVSVEREPATATPMMPAAPTMAAPSAPVFEPEVIEAPLGHFVTTYKLGDDGYDTSFSIETPAGEFLGECGVGISDTVGDGPQKVTAFEVWLFDKNDIKTVTKVLMSDYAYNNETIRKKLQARGDAVLAQKGREVMLETEALRVNAVISDLVYASGGTPQSFFSRLTIELAPTIKNTVPA